MDSKYSDNETGFNLTKGRRAIRRLRSNSLIFRVS